MKNGVAADKKEKIKFECERVTLILGHLDFRIYMHLLINVEVGLWHIFHQHRNMYRKTLGNVEIMLRILVSSTKGWTFRTANTDESLRRERQGSTKAPLTQLSTIT